MATPTVNQAHTEVIHTQHHSDHNAAPVQPSRLALYDILGHCLYYMYMGDLLAVIYLGT